MDAIGIFYGGLLRGVVLVALEVFALVHGGAVAVGDFDVDVETRFGLRDGDSAFLIRIE